MQQAFTAAIEDRCDDVLAVIPAAAARRSFAGYPQFVRRAAHQHAKDCYFESEDFESYVYFLQSLAESGGDEVPLVLHELIWTSNAVGIPEVAVGAVKSLAEINAEELLDIDVYVYTNVQRLLLASENRSDMRYEFLKVLFDNNYYSPNLFLTADRLMLDYAAMAIDRGDTRDTKKIVMSLSEPRFILQVRIDKRFDAVRQDPAVEKFLDLEAAADRHIARLERAIEESPDYAFGHVLLSKALIGTWRFEDALDVIESVALRIREPNANQVFTDAEENKNWVLEQYATALSYVDYSEQSEDMRTEALEVPEIHDINVNQRINMAGSRVYDSRFDEALELLAGVDQTSANPFGYMWVQSTSVCAKALREDTQDYSANLSYLTAHELENPTALARALLCADDIETAARHLIKRIRNPDQRVRALMYLHVAGEDEHTERPHSHAAGEALSPGHTIEHRFDQMRSRADVLSAVEQFGRIETVPLHKSIWNAY
ncbi:MAG: hypothetical protein WBN09_02520 [Woeseiaceae bacterium]